MIDPSSIPLNSYYLRNAVRMLPPITLNGDTWNDHRYHLRNHMENDNPYEFLEWSTMAATMFVGDAPYILDELKELQKRPDWGLINSAINLYPIERRVASSMFPSSTGNTIHQLYHLHQLQLYSGIEVKDLETIVEFGGGYGNMARLTRDLGFSGKYILYDFPECSLLQYWYLSNTVGVDGIEFVNDPAEFFDRRYDADLFISIWALSECSLPDRMPIQSLTYSSYLIVFQHIFASRYYKIDNTAYMDRHIGNYSDTNRHFVQLTSFPSNSYLIGSK